MSRGYWKEKVSELFGQTAHFPPVGSGRKKVSVSLDQSGDFCPVGTEGKNDPSFVKTAPSPQEDSEGRNIQNLSFKTGKNLQWVVEIKISGKCGPL